MECVVRVSSRWWGASSGPTLTTAARETTARSVRTKNVGPIFHWPHARSRSSNEFPALISRFLDYFFPQVIYSQTFFFKTFFVKNISKKVTFPRIMMQFMDFLVVDQLKIHSIVSASK